MADNAAQLSDLAPRSRLESDEPDLWSEVRDQQELAEVAASDDNTSFSSEEQIRIRASLRDVLSQLEARHELNPEQLAVVSNRVEYLADAASRMGRKDWTIIVIGTIASWSMSYAIPPELARGVAGLIWAAIKWAVTGHPQLPAG